MHDASLTVFRNFTFPESRNLSFNDVAVTRWTHPVKIFWKCHFLNVVTLRLGTLNVGKNHSETLLGVIRRQLGGLQCDNPKPW